MAQKIFIQFHFQLFRRMLAPMRLRDHEFPINFLHTLCHCCLNRKKLNNPGRESIWCWISIKNFSENCIVTIDKSRVQTKMPERRRRCPNVSGNARREFVFVRFARWRLHVRRSYQACQRKQLGSSSEPPGLYTNHDNVVVGAGSKLEA